MLFNDGSLQYGPIGEETAEDEIGYSEGVLKFAFDRHFERNPWHFTVEANIFRTQGKTVTNILSKKSKLLFYE